MALICVSYSSKPLRTGSMVNAEMIRFPAFTAELVILASAVTAITSSAENFAWTVSTAPVRPDKLHVFAAALTFSSPFEAPRKSKLCFNFPIVDKLV